MVLSYARVSTDAQDLKRRDVDGKILRSIVRSYNFSAATISRL